MTPEHLGKTTLLIAGPRAGKTAQLLEWRESCRLPTIYFRLTPEDAEPAFALRRMLRDWPSIRTHFEALRAELPSLPWGAVLAMAIDEVLPDLCLLLDDFHLSEETPEAASWLALVRHFPPTGTLAVASRHRLPELERTPLIVWDADHPAFSEAPTREDLEGLPRSLLAKAVVMHVVGEASPSCEGAELVRRNIALQMPVGTHRLRAAWQAIAGVAASPAIPAIWGEVEAELRGFVRRHLRKGKELSIPGILERIPSEVRARSPFLLEVEGEIHLEARRFLEARECFRRAMDLAPDPLSRRDLLIHLLAAAVYLSDDAQAAAILERLVPEEGSDPPYMEAHLLYWRGRMALDAGRVDEALATFQRVLNVPASGDQRVTRSHARALIYLVSINHNLGHVADATSFAERLVNMCLAFDLHRDLLSAFSLRWRCLVLGDSRPASLAKLVDIPEEAFLAPNPTALNLYLTCFAVRADAIAAYDLALRLFPFVLAHAVSQQLTMRVPILKYWLSLTKIRRASDEIDPALLRAMSADEQYATLTPLNWASLFVLSGQLDEAEAAILAHDAWSSAEERVRARLYLGWIRHRRGDSGAADEVRALLATPEGTGMWEIEVEILAELGLREAPALFQMRAFGETAFARAKLALPHWPRKKALSLLAILALHPQGIEAEALRDALYRDSDNSDPAGALRNLVYGLRQVLTPLGAADLLEVARGVYRFKWEQVAHCDLHEFDTLYRKGQDLETAGRLEAAALFYRMAVLTADGALFADLGEDVFEGPRREYAARLEHAQAVVRASGAPW
ncbi:MAG TPA: hypothetical protein V6D00_00300 [Pantanalinema sp.]